MKKIAIFGAVIVLVVGLPLSKKYFLADKTKSVEAETITQRPIKASILASGQLNFEKTIKLSAEVIGKVSQLHVDEGDKVTRGQLLLEIDDEAYVAAVKQQRAVVDQQRVAIEKQQLVLANLKRQWSRKSRLFQKKLLDEDAYEAAQLAYKIAQVDLEANYEQLKQAEAQLLQSKEQLAKTKVKSPITGKVTSLDIKEGETAVSATTNIAGSSLMTIADPQSMLAEINVDEADIAQVRPGQRAEIIAIAFPEQALVGQVESIASSAKAAAGRQSLSFVVKLKLTNENKLALKPGMSSRAEVFIQGEQKRLAVPVRAIQTEEDNDNNSVTNFVYTLEDGIAIRTKVETGLSDDTFQEIISGLNEKAMVITGPDKTLRHLTDGEAVSILEKSKNNAESN